MATTYGYKRLVVGAHYGWKDFLVQRISAALMTAFTLVLLLSLLLIHVTPCRIIWLTRAIPQSVFSPAYSCRPVLA